MRWTSAYLQDMPRTEQGYWTLQAEVVNQDVVLAKKRQCPKCSKSFKDNYKLKRHMQIHTGQFSFYCEQCKKGYNEKSNYLNHMRIKHEGVFFKCDLSDKRFKTMARLKYYMPMHTGRWNFWCEICQMGFGVPSQYEAHRKKH